MNKKLKYQHPVVLFTELAMKDVLLLSVGGDNLVDDENIGYDNGTLQ